MIGRRRTHESNSRGNDLLRGPGKGDPGRAGRLPGRGLRRRCGVARSGSRRCSGRTSRPAASSASRPPSSLAEAASAASTDAAERKPKSPASDAASRAGLPRPRRTSPGSLGRLGHYEVLEVIGRGGMGVVLRGLRRAAAPGRGHQGAGAPPGRPTATARKRFLREARAAAAVRDEHVVAIHAVEEAAETAVPGDGVHRRGLPAGAAGPQRPAGGQGGAAHRPAGRRRPGGRPRPGADPPRHQAGEHPAGKRRRAGQDHRFRPGPGGGRRQPDAEGVVAGTPQYMAPEQARGEALDHRADLFSLGSVLYAMCTGRPPFRAENTLAVLKRVCEDTPRPIREINPEVPRLAGRDHRQAPGQGPGRAVPVGPGSGGSAGPGTRRSAAWGLERPPAPRPRRRPNGRAAAWSWPAAVLLLFAAGFVLTESIGITHLGRDGAGQVHAENRPCRAKGRGGTERQSTSTRTAGADAAARSSHS